MDLDSIMEELKDFKQKVRYYCEVNKVSAGDIVDCLDDLEESIKDAGAAEEEEDEE